MLWSLKVPPSWFPTAVLGDGGWVDPETGEILVAFDEPPLNHIAVRQMGHANIIRVRQLKRRMKGTSRIACPIPTYRGINPNW